MRDRIVAMKPIPLSKIRGFSGGNPKIRTDADRVQLEASLRNHGYVQPVAVRALGDGTYELIDGHHRVEILSELEPNGRIKATVLDVESVAEGRRIMLALQRHAGFDMAKLEAFVAEAVADGAALADLVIDTGMTGSEMELLATAGRRMLDGMAGGSPGKDGKEVEVSGHTRTIGAEDGSDPEIDRNSWCTPKEFADALGKWDLDPCSNDRSHIQATRTFRLDRGEDGLALAATIGHDWRCFVNPPYDDVMPWIEAYGHTRFCFLLKFDPSTKWFAALYEKTQAILIPKGTRIEFEAPPGVPKEKSGANPFPHAFFFARDQDIPDALLALCYVWLVEPDGSPWATDEN